MSIVCISPDQNTVTVHMIDYEFIKTTGTEFYCNECSFYRKRVCREAPCDFRTNLGIPRTDQTTGYFKKKKQTKENQAL
jgi:hypothetical protein